MTSIAHRCNLILSSLQLIGQSTRANGEPTCSTIEDELDRFRLWAGNLGALQQPKSSLSIESRLVEAPNVLLHVAELLDELVEVARELLSITTGERADEIDALTDQELAEEVYDEVALDPQPETAVLSQDSFILNEEVGLRKEIGACITRLFRITSLVRRVIVTDPYTKALSRQKDPINNQFDIAYVGDKFPKIASDTESWLQDRLGSAITNRRSYLSYKQDHREKLEPVPDEKITLKVGEELATASSKPTTYLPDASTAAPMDISLEVYDNDDDSLSMTSISPSVDGESEHLLDSRIPSLDSLRVGNGKEIECPFCFNVRSFRNEKSWRKHVMSDLRAYVCTFPTCGSAMFGDMNEWWHHEMQCHRVQYGCMECNETNFSSSEELLKHIQIRHAQLHAIAGQDSLLKLSRKPVARLRAVECPCCTSWAERLATRAQTQLGDSRASSNDGSVAANAFKRHLASHLEQLALFALPTLAEDEASLKPEATAALSESDALSSTPADSDTSEAFDYGDELPMVSQEPFATYHQISPLRVETPQVESIPKTDAVQSTVCFIVPLYP
jgi:hypothetical protein